MKLKKIALLSTLSLMFAASFNVNAEFIGDLSPEGTLFTYGANTNVNGIISDGGGNQHTVYTAVDATNRTLVSLSGDGFLPIIKVMASGNSYVRAMGFQTYTYQGAFARDITLDVNLHGSITGGSDDLGARIGVLYANEVEFAGDISWGTNFYEYGAISSYGGIADTAYLYTSAVGADQNLTGSVTFTMTPGESFVVYAGIEADSNGGSINAWNTLTMDFDDATGVEAAAHAVANVSAPVSIAALGLAFAGFGLRRKQKVTDA
jgi:hypothetical protein